MTDEEINKEFDKLSHKEYTDDDIRTTLEKEEYVNKLSEKGPLAKADVKENIKNLFNMLKDKDKFKLSKSTLAIIIGALLYVISPIDLVPDVIPVLGLIDDVAILAAATKAIADEIKRYKEWKEKNPSTDKE